MKAQNNKHICLGVLASAAFENHASFVNMDVSLMTQIRYLLSQMVVDFKGLSPNGEQQMVKTAVTLVPAKSISARDKSQFYAVLEKWRQLAADYYSRPPAVNGVKALIAEVDGAGQVCRAWELHELKPVVPSHCQLIANVRSNTQILNEARKAFALYRQHTAQAA